MKQRNISTQLGEFEDKMNNAIFCAEVISKVFFAWIVLNIRKVFARK